MIDEDVARLDKAEGFFKDIRLVSGGFVRGWVFMSRPVRAGHKPPTLRELIDRTKRKRKRRTTSAGLRSGEEAP